MLIVYRFYAITSTNKEFALFVPIFLNSLQTIYPDCGIYWIMIPKH